MVTVLSDVSETARERETFRYDALTISTAGLNSAEPAKPIPSSFLSSTPDPALTAFAQLGLYRLRAARSMISLFDRKFQHIVAEALRPASRPSTSSGEPQEQKWFNGLTFERSTSVCEHVVTGPATSQSIPGTQLGLTPEDIPVSVINRLDGDPRFCYIQDPGRQFYAGVPIRSPKGINIGVYCVFDDQPRPQGLDADEIRFIREISRVVMDYLESKRSHEWYRREQRMVRGLGSFVKGQPTLWNWTQSDSDQLASFQDLPGMAEGSLNKKLQPPSMAIGPEPQDGQASPEALMSERNPPALPIQSAIHPKDFAVTDAVPNLADTMSSAPSLMRSKPYGPETKATIDSNSINRVFSKASNVIREALEVEGVLFLDADVRSYGGLVGKVSSKVPTVAELRNPSSTSSSSGDESAQSQNCDSPSDGHAICDVLGFATSDVSSIVGDAPPAAFAEARERSVQRLLRRYPEGHIWNLEADGTISDHSAGSDGDESPLQERRSFHSSSYPSTTADGQEELLKRPKTHLNLTSLMTKMFPGARSVALVPLWDAQSGRVFSAGFAWTRTPTRAFTTENELTYLRVFGLTTMAEVARLKMRLADQTKTDILGSISHELRSPLHGLVGSIELLRHTALDAMQNGILSAIESSGRTLLDTIEHLLDFAKINAKRASKSRRKYSSLGIEPSHVPVSDALPMPSAPIQLDLLVEEVVESVLAGSNYLTRSEIPSFTTFAASQSLNSTTPKGTPIQPQLPSRLPGTRDTVQTYIDIDHAASWAFRMHPGAFRRIVMNLFGNSLKFTSSGFIRVSLRQESPPKRLAVSGTTQVVLTVSDSGKGMGEEYLRKHLFTAFSQEDQFAVGTGLGLSLVRHTTKAMGGTIEVMSKVGQGTTITVKLPLVQVAGDSLGGHEAEFRKDAQTLSGQSVQLCGFEREIRSRQSFRVDDIKQRSQYQLMESLCQDSLHMNVTPTCSTPSTSPDVVICVLGDGPGCSGLQSTESMSRCPYIFVCEDLASAHKLLEERGGRLPPVYEICSQPIGPRKLARALLGCQSRWRNIQNSMVEAPPEPKLNSENIPPQQTNGAKTSKDWPSALTLQFAQAEQALPPQTRPNLSNEDSLSPLQRPTTPHLPLVVPTTDIILTKTVAATTESRKPILIVDDNVINLKVMAAYLTKLKHTCITAINGLEALQIFSDRPSDFSCVLTDISMPVMDGLESTRRIREFERTAGLKSVVVIALTGLSGVDVRQDAHASGVDLFLTRPLTLNGLKEALAKMGLS